MPTSLAPPLFRSLAHERRVVPKRRRAAALPDAGALFGSSTNPARRALLGVLNSIPVHLWLEFRSTTLLQPTRQKLLHFWRRHDKLTDVIQPLALVFYERLMPGSQLVNRLQDLNYRVLAMNAVDRLTATVQRESPLFLFIDLATPGDVCGAIAELRATPTTAHLPVIGFAPENAPDSLAAALKAGANLAVSETAVINHLPQLIDQALNID
jgi:CheY-like chemotaxis protein